MKPETKKTLTSLAVAVSLAWGCKLLWDAARRPKVEQYQKDIRPAFLEWGDDPRKVRLFCEMKQRDAGLFDWEARRARDELLDEMRSYGRQ